MFKRAVHLGEILKDELEGLDITPTEFARQIDVPPNRVSQIISGKRAITGDTALRFGHWLGTDPQFWLNSKSSSILPLPTVRLATRSAICRPGQLAAASGSAEACLKTLFFQVPARSFSRRAGPSAPSGGVSPV